MPAYDTPEEAALAGFQPNSKPFVVSVAEAQDADHTAVVVDTDPSHPMTCCCQRRRDGRWVFVSDSG
jgi:hypothetical protein